MSTLDEKAHAFAKKYPTPHSHPNGGDYSWDQDCGRVLSRFCREYGKEPTGDVHSAYFAYTRSKIISKDFTKAPAGAVHWWDIGGPLNGHVGLDILGRGSKVFFGNKSVQDISGAIDLGYSSVPGYNAYRPKAKYLGWSYGYADGNIGHFDLPAGVHPIATHPLAVIPAVVKPVVKPVVKKSAPKHAAVKLTVGPVLYSGKDWAYRRPSGELAKTVVKALQEKHRLPSNYLNDGKPGAVFDAAVQKTLNISKVFIGPEDSKIERGGSYGIQTYGAKFGKYTGKHDGHPEVLSWIAFANGLRD